jgi:hypothetical protein
MQGQSVAICTDDISRSQWAEIVESTSLARLAETRPLPTAAAGLPMPIELRHEQRYVQGFSALLFGTGRHAPNSNLTRPSPYALTSIHQIHSCNVILLERDGAYTGHRHRSLISSFTILYLLDLPFVVKVLSWNN